MRMATEATKAKGLARGNAIVGNFAKGLLMLVELLRKVISEQQKYVLF